MLHQSADRWRIFEDLLYVITTANATDGMHPTGDHSVCLRFHLRLSLNDQMAIRGPNSCQITIHQIWKSQLNGQMVIW